MTCGRGTFYFVAVATDNAGTAHSGRARTAACRQQERTRLVRLRYPAGRSTVALFSLPFFFARRGWEGLIAYGCQSVVVVIDPRTVQPLQTLAHHKSNIIRVATAHCSTPLAAPIRTFGGACSLTLCLTQFCVPTTATIDTGYNVPICTILSLSSLSLSPAAMVASPTAPHPGLALLPPPGLSGHQLSVCGVGCGPGCSSH